MYLIMSEIIPKPYKPLNLVPEQRCVPNFLVQFFPNTTFVLLENTVSHLW